VNSLDPQPDFVFYGGDLAQLGQVKELELGAAILKNLKAPLRIMVGEHDWYLDMGEKWQELFGEPTYSFDHKGVHFVVLNSVVEKDFWTERGMTPMERMKTVAGSTTASRAPSPSVSNSGNGSPMIWQSCPTTPSSSSSPLPAVQALQTLELLDRRRPGGAGPAQAFPACVVIHGHTTSC
jgi:hypothetical protein